MDTRAREHHGVPRPTTVRCLGFCAAVLLAVVGWLGGALPGGDTASTPISIARGPYGPVVLGGWVVGTALLAYAWWALRDRVPSARWALVTAVLWALPFLVVPPLGSRDVYSYACQGYLYVHGLNPYEFGVGSLPCPWLEAVSPIWRDTAAPYGPLFLLISAGVVRLGGDSLVGVVLAFRLVALVGLAAVALGLPVLARRCGVPAGRALWIALAGPLVGAHLLAGPHNDTVMIGLVVAGLAVAAADRLRPRGVGWGVAGVLLGLAVAVKVTAIVVVPFAMLLVVARPFRWRQAAAAVGLMGAAAVSAMIGVTEAGGLGFGWIGGMVNTRDLVQFTSPPTAIGMTLTYLGRLVVPGFDAVPVLRLVGLLLFVVLLPVLWWRGAGLPRPRLPVRLRRWLSGLGIRRVAPEPGIAEADRQDGSGFDSRAAAVRGAALALAATVALSPYFHPWYVVWPMVLLAATLVRTGLLVGVVIATAFLVLPDGGGLARFAKFPGAPIMTVLLVVLLVRHLRDRAAGLGREPAPSTPPGQATTSGLDTSGAASASVVGR
jgi:hypothetical protein